MSLTCAEVRDLAAAYALDALEEDEREQVRLHVRDCPDPHLEIAEMAAVVPQLALAAEPVEPRPQLRDRLMAAAAAEAIHGGSMALGDAVLGDTVLGGRVPARDARPETPGIPLATRGPRPSMAWAVAGVAVVLMLALGALAALQARDLDSLRSYERGVAAVLDLAATDGSQVAILTADGESDASGLAAVGADGSVALALRGLQPTSGDQVYEAWYIVGDGPPLALGGFRVDASGGGSITAAAPAPSGEPLVLAVTLEPAPGATAPGGPIVAAGPAN